MEIIGDPYILKGFHGWSTCFWLPFTVLSFFLGWLESVIFVSLVSMIALFLGSFSSWQASRTEVQQGEVLTTHQDKKNYLRNQRPTILISRRLRKRRLERV